MKDQGRGGLRRQAMGLLLACLGGASPMAAQAAAERLQLVAAQSQIGFVSHQMGVPVAGRFRSFTAEVDFDPQAPEQDRFLIDVDLASVELPTADAMREVLKPTWFDTARFPRAQFKSSAVRAVRPGEYEIRGQMVIKGRPIDLVVPVHVQTEGDLRIATGSLTVRRLAFAIGEGEWSDTSMVADEVEVSFRLTLAGARPR